MPGAFSWFASMSWSPARTWPVAMKSCTPVTTIGMIVKGFDTQVTSAIMPTFMTCASICPKPACSLPRPDSGRDENAGRAHERVDDVADLQDELFHPAVDAGIDRPSC